jgi:hypothetical protein
MSGGYSCGAPGSTRLLPRLAPLCGSGGYPRVLRRPIWGALSGPIATMPPDRHPGTGMRVVLFLYRGGCGAALRITKGPAGALGTYAPQ